MPVVEAVLPAATVGVIPFCVGVRPFTVEFATLKPSNVPIERLNRLSTAPAAAAAKAGAEEAGTVWRWYRCGRVVLVPGAVSFKPPVLPSAFVSFPGPSLWVEVFVHAPAVSESVHCIHLTFRSFQLLRRIATAVAANWSRASNESKGGT